MNQGNLSPLVLQDQNEPCNPRVIDLYGENYDFPFHDSEPEVSYMLATLPRSGSTHLAMELWRTGVMGAPMEYANAQFMEATRKRLRSDDDYAAYWRDLKHRRTSPNGVFGFKMFVADYLNGGNNHPDLLTEIIPDKVVFLTRSNIIEQAVSYSKALRSGAWFHGVEMKEKPVYDAGYLESCVASLQYQVDFWNELFALTNTNVHHVTYESLVENQGGVIKGIAEFLGIGFNPSFELDLPRMKVQRDIESAEWAQKFSLEKPVDDGT